jgi:hypothetical protein
MAGSGSPESAPEPADLAALRAEHDALAARLAVRRSVDEARKAAYGGFFGVIAGGFAGRLAWDRWISTRVTAFKGPPVFFFVALAIALVLAALTVTWALRARRLGRGEDAEFARFRELRAKLGTDP